jgi:hypothetical protein
MKICATNAALFAALALAACQKAPPEPPVGPETDPTLASADTSVAPAAEPDAPVAVTPSADSYFKNGYSGKVIFQSESCIVYKTHPDSNESGGYLYVATGTCAVAH